MRGNVATEAPATLRVSLIDRRIEEYTKQQLSRQAILEQLLAARWPLEQLRPRFPDFTDSSFCYPEVSSKLGPKPASTSAPIKVLPSVATPFVDHAALQKAVTAAEGISFQYVPL